MQYHLKMYLSLDRVQTKLASGIMICYVSRNYR